MPYGTFNLKLTYRLYPKPIERGPTNTAIQLFRERTEIINIVYNKTN